MLAKKTKRILASLLTAAMVVGLLPMSVLAAGGELLSPESKVLRHGRHPYQPIQRQGGPQQER